MEYILHQGPRFGKTVNASPFCIKLESFLRHFNVPYTIAPFNPIQAPRGKMPYITIDDRLLADSEAIFDHLIVERNLKFEIKLTSEQQALAHTTRRMLEEATYFCGVHKRWCVDENWRRVKNGYFDNIPKEDRKN